MVTKLDIILFPGVPGWGLRVKKNPNKDLSGLGKEK